MRQLLFERYITIPKATAKAISTHSAQHNIFCTRLAMQRITNMSSPTTNHCAIVCIIFSSNGSRPDIALLSWYPNSGVTGGYQKGQTQWAYPQKRRVMCRRITRAKRQLPITQFKNLINYVINPHIDMIKALQIQATTVGLSLWSVQNKQDDVSLQTKTQLFASLTFDLSQKFSWNMQENQQLKSQSAQLIS